MDIDGFIAEIKKRRDLKEVVHHEVIPALPPSYADTAGPIRAELKEALLSLGIARLYSHQAAGIDLIRDGKNIVIMTPTASGKSLIYNIPVIESMLEEKASSALYIFPLKGLEQDQMRAFNLLASNLPEGLLKPFMTRTRKKAGFEPWLSEIYDGDTSAYRRRKIREAPPPVVLTNPDMLHLAINAYHPKWENFLRNLKYVIIDEIHTYRGVFGSHVAHVLRRLRRILRLYGSDPVFIACSATIANPEGLAGMLTGLPFELVSKSGSPQGKRNFLFLNPLPDASPYTIATRLFTASVKAGLKTIVFTKARKITELMHARVRDAHPELSSVVCSYRAGFLPEERREIERKLFSGALTGVISTSALELGVDIGGLDVCILAGYPGTISSTWQRSGRVGRSGRDCLIVMVGTEDALDQHFMRNPFDFFRRTTEAAVVDGENKPIAKAHLLCAASEAYLKPGDSVYDVDRFISMLEELEAEKKIRRWAKGGIWFPRTRYPHRYVSIREAGEPYLIVNDDGRPIGESSASRVLYDLHPGAVYLHKGSQYIVRSLDMAGKKVVCASAGDIAYYTSAMTDEDTEIVSVEGSAALNGVNIDYGTLRVTEAVLGYRKKHIFTGKTLGEFPLDLPASVFTTKGVWMKVDEAIVGEIKSMGHISLPGSLHALEHAAIAALPLFALCDRFDLGGVSYPLNPQLESAAIFIYDGYEGGVGLSRRGFECVKDWFAATLKLMEECSCEVSCPSCTQDPKCGNNNDPLDKRGAVIILKKWLEGR